MTNSKPSNRKSINVFFVTTQVWVNILKNGNKCCAINDKFKAAVGICEAKRRKSA